MVEFVRKFVPNLVAVIEPLVGLTRKEGSQSTTFAILGGPAEDHALLKSNLN